MLPTRNCVWLSKRSLSLLEMIARTAASSIHNVVREQGCHRTLHRGCQLLAQRNVRATMKSLNQPYDQLLACMTIAAGACGCPRPSVGVAPTLLSTRKTQ
eukprot:6200929-Pleurochrysis_carterae.AAC.3